MGIRQFKPVTPATRFRSVSDFGDITKTEPERSLLEPLPRTGGRNNKGHITSRYMGGGRKRQYRRIDFRRDKFGVPAKVASVEYDPNRTARIVLLHYADGEKRYILAPKGLAVGDTVVSGPGADIRIGNAMPLFEIPLGGDRRAGRGERGESRHAAAPLHGDAHGARRVPRHDRGGLQRRARAAVHRQGRQEPLAGAPAAGARRGDEPRRSPAGRRGGQDLGRPAADLALGQGRREEDPAQEEAVDETHRARP